MKSTPDKLNVFFYEAFEEEAEALKHYLPNYIKAGFTWKTIQEHGDSEPSAPVISIRTQSVIPGSWAGKLSGILSRSTGYDHIKTYLHKCRANIPCGYLPLYCSRAVAEQAMLLWMSLLRKLPQQMKQFTNFYRDGLTGYECEHRTLLVVGVGNVGYEVVRIGEGLGMKVLGVDIVKKHPSVSYVSIEEGIVQADIIVCAMNLTPENSGYFNYNLLKKAKQGAIFINIARGELSPSAALLLLLVAVVLVVLLGRLDALRLHERRLLRLDRLGLGLDAVAGVAPLFDEDLEPCVSGHHLAVPNHGQRNR